jgi:hypothetical protein
MAYRKRISLFAVFRFIKTELIRYYKYGLENLRESIQTSFSYRISNEYFIKPVLPTAPFYMRDGAASVSFAGRIWLFGGWTQTIDRGAFTNNEIWSSTNGLDWDYHGQAPWEPRHVFPVVEFQNKLWLIGGDANSKHYQTDVWISSDGIHWTLIAENIPCLHRITHYVVVFNEKIWLIGGIENNEILKPEDKKRVEGKRFNDVWSTKDGINWTLESEKTDWVPRGMISGQAVLKNKIYLVAGGTYDIRRFYNDVWSSPDGVHWHEETANAAFSKRSFVNITVFDDKIWLVGGLSPAKRHLRDIWYSQDGRYWQQLVIPKNYLGRHACSLVVHQNVLWVIAGHQLNDVWKIEKNHFSSNERIIN